MEIAPWKPFGELNPFRKELDRLWDRGSVNMDCLSPGYQHQIMGRYCRNHHWITCFLLERGYHDRAGALTKTACKILAYLFKF